MKEWLIIGIFINHSRLNKEILNKIFRLEIRLSKIIEINIIINKVEEIDPNDEIWFQKIIKSLNIIYRRGIPFNPKKCWGKNVKLIHINKLIKLINK